MEPERTLRVLEFPKILERLASYAMTDSGKACCRTLVPSADEPLVRRSLDETEEAVVLLTYLGSNPLIGFSDVTEYITIAQKGACLPAR